MVRRTHGHEQTALPSSVVQPYSHPPWSFLHWLMGRQMPVDVCPPSCTSRILSEQYEDNSLKDLVHACSSVLQLLVKNAASRAGISHELLSWSTRALTSWKPSWQLHS